MLASKSCAFHKGVSSTLAMALTVSLCAQALLTGPAQALSFIAAKKSALQTPMESKLDEDSGPMADTTSGDSPLAADVPAEPKAEKKESKPKKTAKASPKDAKKDAASQTASSSSTDSKVSQKDGAPVSLAPLTLSEDDKKSADAEASTSSPGDSNYMKLHAETMGVAPKGPLDGDAGSEPTTLPSKSLKSELQAGNGKLVDKAKNVNVMPLALQDSDAEADQKTITDLDCEKAQISELWEATLNRNQDIQFVVQKLMPSTDKGRTTTMLMRLIGSAVCAGASGVTMMSPSPLTYGGTQAASSAVMNLMGLVDSKQQKRASIDQGQCISLYNMVRTTADKVTETYRDYKKHVRRIDRSQRNTDNLQNMIQEARAGQDAAKQIEMEYWVAKSRGDLEEAVSDARRYRQSLIDLAGVDAVNKLDQALNDQLLAEQGQEKPIAELLPGQKPAPENTKGAKEKFTPAQQNAFNQLLESQGGVKRIAAPGEAIPQ